MRWLKSKKKLVKNEIRWNEKHLYKVVKKIRFQA